MKQEMEMPLTPAQGREGDRSRESGTSIGCSANRTPAPDFTSPRPPRPTAHRAPTSALRRRTVRCAASVRPRTGQPRFAAHWFGKTRSDGAGIEPATIASTMRCSTRLSYPVVERESVRPRHTPRQRRTHRTGGPCRPEPEPLRNVGHRVPIGVSFEDADSFQKLSCERKTKRPGGHRPSGAFALRRKVGRTDLRGGEVRSWDERVRARAFEPWRVHRVLT